MTTIQPGVPDEAERIREAYAARAARGDDDRYALTDRANLYLYQRRERALIEDADSEFRFHSGCPV